MIPSLITESLIHKTTKYLRDFPRILLDTDEAEVIDYILAFESKHGEPPSPKRMQSTKYKAFVSPSVRTGSPLDDTFEQAVNFKKAERFRQFVSKIDEAIDNDGEIPMDKLGEMVKTISTVGKRGYVSYKEFDRTGLYSVEMGSGLNLGFAILDSVIGQIEGGEICLFGGRPGSGKTMIIAWIAKNWLSIGEGKRILLISNEMPAQSIIARIDAMVGRFDSSILRKKDDETELTKRRLEVEGAIKTSLPPRSDIIMPSSKGLTPLSIPGLVQEHDIDAVIVDAVYLMKLNGEGGSRGWENVASISSQMKQIAMETGVPFLMTTQLKRGTKEEVDLDSLAFSDALGQDADVVIAITNGTVMRNDLMLEIIKNRNGRIIGQLVTIDYSTSQISQVGKTDFDEDIAKETME